jgi:hypothetical protein
MESRRAAPRRTLPANPQRSTRSSSRVSAAAPPLRAGRASSFVRSSRLGSAETDDESAGRAPPERYALVPSSRTRVSHVLRRAEPEEVEEEEEYAQKEAAYEMEPQDDYDGMSEQDRTAVPRYSTARQRQSSSRTGGATSFAENAASSPPAVSPRKRPAGRTQTSRLSESVRPASRNAYSARVAQELLRPRMSAVDDARRPDAAFEAPAARRPRATMPSRERNRLSSEQDRSLPRPTQTTQSASFATAVERLRGGRSSGAGNVSGRAPSGRGDISGNQSVVSFAPDSSYVRRRSQLAASEGRSTSRTTSVAGAPRLRRSLVGDDGQIHEPSLAERCGALETNASKLLSFYAGLVQDGAKSGSVAEMRRCWDPFHCEQIHHATRLAVTGSLLSVADALSQRTRPTSSSPRASTTTTSSTRRPCALPVCSRIRRSTLIARWRSPTAPRSCTTCTACRPTHRRRTSARAATCIAR